METFLDGPTRRIAHRVRLARLEAQRSAQRRVCDDCGRRRMCAKLEVLSAVERWYCLSVCWPYRLGALHGERITTREIRAQIEAYEGTLR
jgi:hypothetical protein